MSPPRPTIVVATQPHELFPAPINPAWVREGNPQAHATRLAQSADTFCSTFAWTCTAGTFDWHFTSDENLVMLEGELFFTDDAGVEHRLGPGDAVLFRRGAHSVWRVPLFMKKISCLYDAPPLPVSFGLRVWRKIRNMIKPAPKVGF